LEQFIDQPVKHYSSGMYVRLGFAVAVEVDPDILLIDEVLAVGDAQFQRKCVEKMDAFRRAGKTMLIISHDLPTILSISDRILLLDQGRVAGLGKPDSVVSHYRSLTRNRSVSGLERVWGTGDITIEGVDFRDGGGQPTDTFASGTPLQACIRYRAAGRVDNPVFGFALSDSSGRLIYGSNTQICGHGIPFVSGEGRLTLRLETLPVAAGTYLFSFAVHSADHRTNYHRLDHCFPITVTSEARFEGICFIPCLWQSGAAPSQEASHGPA
jgi:hypothetical protein